MERWSNGGSLLGMEYGRVHRVWISKYLEMKDKVKGEKKGEGLALEPLGALISILDVANQDYYKYIP